MPSAITFNIPAINDLTDVVITAAAAGDVLRHDGANWVDYALDQAAVAGLTTASGPTFDYLNLGTKHIQATTRARAYLNTQQSNITSSSWIKVLLDAEDYDSGSNFSTVNNRFTAPVSGYYQINASVSFLDIQAGYSYFLLVRINNGATDAFWGVTIAPGAVARASDCYYLAANDYVELYVNATAPGNTTDIAAGSLQTALSIHLLSIA